MNALILGAGLWAQGQTSFVALSRAEAAEASMTEKAPRPSLVAARELRRLPTPARLAIEVAGQACDMAGVALDAVTPFFTSAIGDAEITDYMCRELAGKEKLLSPTRFQNSVHNAAAGCLSIASGNTRANTFVSSFEKSLAVTLFESLTWLQVHGEPVLLVTTDVPISGPLADVHGGGELASSAVLLAAPRSAHVSLGSLATSIKPLHESAQQRVARQDQRLAGSATRQAWPLLVALAARVPFSQTLALGTGSALSVELTPATGEAAGEC